MDVTQALAVLVVALVMGWFAYGVIGNVRRGNAMLHWLQTGLPRLGQRTSLRWLGSSAVQLDIGQARAPFRRVEVWLVLEPRDVPWFWLLARARGRRDMLMVRGQLVHSPLYEFDLLAPDSWSERETLAHGLERPWEIEPLEGMHFRAPQATRSVSRRAATDLLVAAHEVAPTIWRLSCRREFPQLELHVPLPDPRRIDAAQPFEALRSLADKAGKPVDG